MKQSGMFGLFVVLVMAACSSSPLATAPAVNAPVTKTSVVVVPTAEAAAAPTTVAAATTPVQPVGQPADAKAAIGAALEALDKNGPYRMTITALSEDGGLVTLDVVPPDRSWYKGSVDGKPVEVIDIGNTSYMLDMDGTWQTSTITDESTSDMLMDPAMLNALTNVEILPPENLNGTSTTVYSFVDPASPDVKVTLWVSEDKGRPVQMQMATSDETVLYVIEYDASIKVVPPVK